MKIAGIVFVILGALAILFPYVAGLSYNFILAYLILFAGAAHLWWAWRPSREDRTQHLILGLLFLAGGVCLLVFPWIGLISFTIILGVSFILQGGVQLALASNSQRPAGNSKTMLVLSGLAGIVAGALILIGLPSSAAWAIGILAGINMLIFGAALLVMDKALSEILDD